MSDGIIILVPFLVQTETETMVAVDFQFQPDILFQLHFKQASTAVSGTEKPAVVAFGNDNFTR